MTIADVVQTVLRETGRAMSVNEIYDEITKRNLYTFGAKNPKGVMTQAIRERSDANPKAKVVLFKSMGKGIYTLAQ